MTKPAIAELISSWIDATEEVAQMERILLGHIRNPSLPKYVHDHAAHTYRRIFECLADKNMELNKEFPATETAIYPWNTENL